jgi:hypothetical protein
LTSGFAEVRTGVSNTTAVKARPVEIDEDIDIAVSGAGRKRPIHKAKSGRHGGVHTGQFAAQNFDVAANLFDRAFFPCKRDDHGNDGPTRAMYSR